MRRVVVSVKLDQGPVFMSEHALQAKIASHRLIESSTIVSFEFVAVHQDCPGGELLLRMRIPALILKPALGRLDPVTAKLVLLVASAGQRHDRTLLLIVLSSLLLVAAKLSIVVAIVLVRHSLRAPISLNFR